MYNEAQSWTRTYLNIVTMDFINLTTSDACIHIPTLSRIGFGPCPRSFFERWEVVAHERNSECLVPWKWCRGREASRVLTHVTLRCIENVRFPSPRISCREHGAWPTAICHQQNGKFRSRATLLHASLCLFVRYGSQYHFAWHSPKPESIVHYDIYQRWTCMPSPQK